MTHKDVLVHVLQVDNVSVGTSTPMEVQLTTRLGHISENLIGRRRSTRQIIYYVTTVFAVRYILNPRKPSNIQATLNMNIIISARKKANFENYSCTQTILGLLQHACTADVL